MNNARTEPPPSVTVVVEPPDSAEIERIVDERLRERDQDAADEPSSTAAPERGPDR